MNAMESDGNEMIGKIKKRSVSVNWRQWADQNKKRQ
jgi:hypothetical protein